MNAVPMFFLNLITMRSNKLRPCATTSLSGSLFLSVSLSSSSLWLDGQSRLSWHSGPIMRCFCCFFMHRPSGSRRCHVHAVAPFAYAWDQSSKTACCCPGTTRPSPACFGATRSCNTPVSHLLTFLLELVGNLRFACGHVILRDVYILACAFCDFFRSASCVCSVAFDGP